MLVIKLKLNIPLIVTDTDTGKTWTMFLYYQQGGKPTVAFDLPSNITVTVTKGIKPPKEIIHDESDQYRT